MDCPKCGTEMEESRSRCARCGARRPPAALPPEAAPAVAGSAADVIDDGDPVDEDETARIASVRRTTVRLAAAPEGSPDAPVDHVVDVLACVALLAVTLVLSTAIAGRRTGAGLYAVVAHPTWLHLTVAAAVVVGYFYLGRTVLDGTLGQRRARPAPAAGRALGQVAPVVPAALGVVVAGALVVGFTTNPRPYVAAPPPVVPTPTLTTFFPPPTPTLSPSAAPTADPRAQAVAVDDLLGRSGASRGSLRPALDLVSGCRGLAGAENTIRQIAAERKAELDEATTLPFGALPNGATLYNELVTALTASTNADNDYALWAYDARTLRCGQDNQHRRDGDAASMTATAAKRRFLALWNPLAQSYGLRVWQESDI